MLSKGEMTVTMLLLCCLQLRALENPNACGWQGARKVYVIWVNWQFTVSESAKKKKHCLEGIFQEGNKGNMTHRV